jgi:hypothetical protein
MPFSGLLLLISWELPPHVTYELIIILLKQFLSIYMEKQSYLYTIRFRGTSNISIKIRWILYYFYLYQKPLCGVKKERKEYCVP